MPIKVKYSAQCYLGVLATSAIALLCGDLNAQSPYVDTTALKPHVEMGPPPIITAPDHIMGRAENQFKQGTVENTPGAADKVAAAKKTARLSFGYDNGIKTGAAQAAHRGGDGYMMGSLRKDDAGSYEDRDGTDLHYGYDRTTGQFVVGMTPDAQTELKFVGVVDHIDDDLQPHHAMDPNKTERHVGKTFLTFKNVGALDKLQAYVSAVDLERRADNYSLRDNTGAQLRVEVDRRIYEMGASGEFTTGSFKNNLGFSVKRDDLNAQRYNVTAGDVINSYRFPGVEQTTTSLWGDSNTNLNDTARLKMGLRYDYLKGEASKADNTPTTGMGPFDLSAMDLYSLYYGADDAKVSDHNISAKFKLEQDLNLSNGMVYGEVGRMMRSPPYD